MHSIAEIGTNVPAFLGKLWKMVEDPETNDLIAWSSTGTSFVIKDEIRFARELLPMYYKHNNMASFIRQLNMYGFHKIVSPEAGSMKHDIQEEIKFTHNFFMQGHPYLLENIKRKIGVSKVDCGQVGEKNPQVINKVLTDMRQMKGRQESMESRLTAMKLENGALWRELSVLRQKHLKQQQIVNKLIQFLVTIVQQNHNSFSVKRKFPRMLQHHVKSPKNIIVNEDHLQEDNSNSSPTGPVIHELDPAEVLLETVVEEANNADNSVSDYFINQSSEVDDTTPVVINVEMPQSAEIQSQNNQNSGSILGIPEDTLVFPEGKKSTKYFVPKQQMKEADFVRPKYIKVVNQKPKKYGISQLNQNFKTDTTSLRDSNVKLIIKPDKSSQIRRPNGSIPRQMNKAQNQRLKNQQQQLQNNIQERLVRVQPPVQRNQQQKLLKIDQKNMGPEKVNETQIIHNGGKVLSAKDIKQEINITQDQPQISPESLLTTFNDGVNADVFTDVGSTTLYVDGTNEAVTIPMIVEVPPESMCATMISPQLMDDQNMLMTSPIVEQAHTPQPQQSPSLAVPSTFSPSPPANSEMQVACVSDDGKVTSPSPVTRNDLDSHVENMQSDLDNLKELLRSEGISLDANALLGYFNEDPLSYNISDPVVGDQSKENLGNELMTYSPSLLDLTDLMGNEWSLPASPSEELPVEDTFAEVNTPQFVPQSPSFPTPAKKRKK